MDRQESKKYVMEENLSMETFVTSLRDLDLGKLEPYLGSEPIPEWNDKPNMIPTKHSKGTMVAIHS